MDDLYRGQRIGKYEILTQLTLGGMAELFLAFTSGPGGFRKYVVVKRILPDVKQDDQFVRMFLDEARITAQFSHPNIAQVFDLGEEEDGLYLAMEFISGQNLNQLSAACNRARRSIPVGFACTVARDICNALQYAHTFTDPVGRPAPVVHRDVAQKNVMVTYDGMVKLLDFGIAKAKVKLGRTGVGMVKGTTGYMSPEQVRGDDLDGRSDVFSVGVMLHEMLCGKRLYSAETELEEMKLVLETPAQRVTELNDLVSEELAEVVARALSKEKADRFSSAREMAKAIERAAGKLLFDQEQVAALMKELFADRMAATRALLESAGAADASLLARAAVTALRSGDNEALSFEESVVTHRPDKLRPPAPRDTAVKAQEVAPTREENALQSEVDQLADAKESRWGVVAAVLIAVGVVAGGYGVYRFIFSLPPAAEEDAALPVYNDPRIKPFQADSGPAQAKVAPAPPVPEEDEEPSRPSPASARKPKKGDGSLTLITNPESTVLRGQAVLGTTPLWNAALPEGTHLLRLKGPDGKVRLLSAPIKANQNTRFRVSLADLPME